MNRISSPSHYRSDIHGQLWNLLELLRKGGKVPEIQGALLAYIILYVVFCIQFEQGDSITALKPYQLLPALKATKKPLCTFVSNPLIPKTPIQHYNVAYNTNGINNESPTATQSKATHTKTTLHLRRLVFSR